MVVPIKFFFMDRCPQKEPKAKHLVSKKAIPIPEKKCVCVCVCGGGGGGGTEGGLSTSPSES